MKAEIYSNNKLSKEIAELRDIVKDNDDYIDELEYDLSDAICNIDVSVVCDVSFQCA